MTSAQVLALAPDAAGAMRSVQTRVIAFDTALVDLSEKCGFGVSRRLA